MEREHTSELSEVSRAANTLLLFNSKGQTDKAEETPEVGGRNNCRTLSKKRSRYAHNTHTANSVNILETVYEDSDESNDENDGELSAGIYGAGKRSKQPEEGCTLAEEFYSYAQNTIASQASSETTTLYFCNKHRSQEECLSVGLANSRKHFISSATKARQSLTFARDYGYIPTHANYVSPVDLRQALPLTKEFAYSSSAAYLRKVCLSFTAVGFGCPHQRNLVIDCTGNNIGNVYAICPSALDACTNPAGKVNYPYPIPSIKLFLRDNRETAIRRASLLDACGPVTDFFSWDISENVYSEVDIRRATYLKALNILWFTDMCEYTRISCKSFTYHALTIEEAGNLTPTAEFVMHYRDNGLIPWTKFVHGFIRKHPFTHSGRRYRLDQQAKYCLSMSYMSKFVSNQIKKSEQGRYHDALNSLYSLIGCDVVNRNPDLEVGVRIMSDTVGSDLSNKEDYSRYLSACSEACFLVCELFCKAYAYAYGPYYDLTKAPYNIIKSIGSPEFNYAVIHSVDDKCGGEGNIECLRYVLWRCLVKNAVYGHYGVLMQIGRAKAACVSDGKPITNQLLQNVVLASILQSTAYYGRAIKNALQADDIQHILEVGNKRQEIENSKENDSYFIKFARTALGRQIVHGNDGKYYINMILLDSDDNFDKVKNI